MIIKKLRDGSICASYFTRVVSSEVLGVRESIEENFFRKYFEELEDKYSLKIQVVNFLENENDVVTKALDNGKGEGFYLYLYRSGNVKSSVLRLEGDNFCHCYLHSNATEIAYWAKIEDQKCKDVKDYERTLDENRLDFVKIYNISIGYDPTAEEFQVCLSYGELLKFLRTSKNKVYQRILTHFDEYYLEMTIPLKNIKEKSFKL